MDSASEVTRRETLEREFVCVFVEAAGKTLFIFFYLYDVGKRDLTARVRRLARPVNR